MREDKAWTFILCFVCGSHPRGAAALLLCYLFYLLKSLTVRRFLPPSPLSTNCVTIAIIVYSR